MAQTFAEALVDAQGRSEFVIVVVADIRGFSAFSTINESPNIAMFIKRFYLQLINDYFKDANFVKPTGDGLLMTFPYSEQNLTKVSEMVIGSCLSCLNDFPTICENDPMINFEVPQAIGFGVARGTACCLYSGEQILDYSGHLLNLAARLNDLARPSGIVIDGNFLMAIVPESQKQLFKTQKVYLRSIAEEKPVDVLFLESHVRISDLALSPMAGQNWKTGVRSFTKSQMGKLGSYWREPLDSPAKSAEDIRVTVSWPNKKVKDVREYRDFKEFTYAQEGTESIVRLNMEKIRTLSALTLSARAKLSIKIEYIPKLLPRT